MFNLEEEVKNFVEIEEAVFDKIKNEYNIDIVDRNENEYTINISNLSEEEFEDLANEIAVYHEYPNDYWELLHNYWHTNKNIKIATFVVTIEDKVVVCRG